MDNLPLGPLLGALALALIWSALFATVDAARQQMLQRRNGQQGERPLLELPLSALILCASLGKLLVFALAVQLGLRCMGDTGFWAGAAAAAAALLVFAEYMPAGWRDAAQRQSSASATACSSTHCTPFNHWPACSMALPAC